MRSSSDKPSSIPVGSATELRSAKSNAAAEVLGPTGKSELSLADSTKARSFTFNGEGFYEIRRANQKPEIFALNADRRESDLTPMAQESLDSWKKTGEASVSAAASKPGDAQEQERTYSPWRWVLFILLLVAVAETLIGSRYLSESKDSVPGGGGLFERKREAV